MQLYSTVNEMWAPGYRPDPRAAATELIGEDAVATLEKAGLRLESIFWDVTRQAVRDKTGHAAKRSS